MDPARRLWTLYEPIHALIYFAPEARAAFESAGLRGFWRGYFAGRAAPMGAIGAGSVTASFFGFHPDFVGRAIPEVWSLCSPETALKARLEGADSALRSALGNMIDGEGIARGAALLSRACAAANHEGRALSAANAALEWPDQPHLRLWHAATLLREHRGDGHVVALTASELGPCEAHVLRLAISGEPPDSIQPYRGWDETDWEEATDRLRERGLLDENSNMTGAGRDTYEAAEALTDQLATRPVAAISGQLDEVAVYLEPIVARLEQTGAIPYPNPIGVPSITP